MLFRSFLIIYSIYFKYLFISSIKSLITISKLNNSFIKSSDQKHNHQKYFINYFNQFYYLFIIYKLFISSIKIEIIKYQLLKSSNLFLFTIKSKNYYSTLSFFYFNKFNLQIKNTSSQNNLQIIIINKSQ